jgi:hypothetical protein
MPGISRGLADGFVYHVLNRGNGRQEVFHKDKDYDVFIGLIRLRFQLPASFSTTQDKTPGQAGGQEGLGLIPLKLAADKRPELALGFIPLIQEGLKKKDLDTGARHDIATFIFWRR